MTYCLGMLLDDGLVMMADTRTNAGIDSISTYRKLHLFEGAGHSLVVASAGSLSTTQAAMGHLREGLTNPDTGQVETLDGVTSTFRAVTLIGHALHKAKQEVDAMTAGDKINVDATLLVGGRVGDEPLRLFLVYSAGNFIEGASEAPYLQIGEKKYGKPIIDRSLKRTTALPDAIKVGLISFDSTMRSNLAVGLPIDLIVMRKGATSVTLNRRIEADDPYMRDLGERWQAALKAAAASIPAPPYAFSSGAYIARMFTAQTIAAETKADFYADLGRQLDGLIGGETDRVANLANMSALIFDLMPDLNWAGFYLMKEGELVLGPFQGKTACIRIALGRGVCGTAAATRETQLVADVEAFPGHIACDSASRSELVVPIIVGGSVFGVLDLDSPSPARFDTDDQAGVEHLVSILERRL